MKKIFSIKGQIELVIKSKNKNETKWKVLFRNRKTKKKSAAFTLRSFEVWSLLYLLQKDKRKAYRRGKKRATRRMP